MRIIFQNARHHLEVRDAAGASIRNRLEYVGRNRTARIDFPLGWGSPNSALPRRVLERVREGIPDKIKNLVRPDIQERRRTKHREQSLLAERGIQTINNVFDRKRTLFEEFLEQR